MNTKLKPTLRYKFIYGLIFIGVLSLASYCTYRFVEDFESIDWVTSSTERIPQKIGGALICEWQESMDLHSWDLSIEYSYENGNNRARHIGYGGFHGVNWSPEDQIVKIGDWYYLLTGDGDRGQMLLYGKLTDTAKWKKFYLSPDSVMIDTNWKKLNKYDLELVGESNFNNYSRVLIKCFNPTKKAMVVSVQNFRFLNDNSFELCYFFDQFTGIPILKGIRP